MGGDKLASALQPVNWQANIDAFLNDASKPSERLVSSAELLALWAHHLEIVDKGNVALCFVRESQLSVQNVATLIALGLYKPAAASMRSCFEAILYYTYFRSHHQELSTLARDNGYYTDKKAIFDYHKSHSLDFGLKQHKMGLIAKSDKWYSKVSAVIHGQIPGSWVTYKQIEDVSYSKKVMESAVSTFEEGILIIRDLLLCTIASDVWHGFTPSAKTKFLAGIPAEQRLVLGLEKK